MVTADNNLVLKNHDCSTVMATMHSDSKAVPLAKHG